MNSPELNLSHQQTQNGWWSRERTLVLVLFLATMLAFFLCYLLARPFLAAAAAVSVVAITVVVPTLFLTQRLAGETIKAVETIQTEAATGRWHAIMQRNPQLAPILSRIEAQVDLRGTVQRAAYTMTARFSSFVRGSVWFLVELLVTFFFLFYFFRDRRLALNALKSVVPLFRRRNPSGI